MNIFTKRGYAADVVKLESRLCLSASRWQEEALWMLPFITTCTGKIAWSRLGVQP
jgi:hypothetical protein